MIDDKKLKQRDNLLALYFLCDELAWGYNLLVKQILSKYGNGFPDDFRNTDTQEMRVALGKASLIKDNEWFKRIDHGEFLGEIIFSHFDELNSKRLKIQLENLLNWIDE